MEQEKQPPAARQQMETAWQVQERPFTSTTPLVGPLLVWLRTAWNNVSTKWYVRSVIQQQNKFNLLTIQQFDEVERGFAAASAGMSSLENRLAAFDDRLLSQDRDQSDAIHDVGELTAQLVQLRRQLQLLEERLARLEQTSSQDERGE